MSSYFKLPLLLAVLTAISFVSCTKNAEDVPGMPSQLDTAYTNVIERLTYRHQEDTGLVEDVYSLKYDDQSRLSEIVRVGKGMLSHRFNYNGDKLVSVTVFATNGDMGANYVLNKSLFIREDTLSFYHTVFLTFQEVPDTVYNEYFFNNNVLNKATFGVGSARPESSYSYDGYLFTYNTDGNINELGWNNSSGVYNRHMNVMGVDDKNNPYFGVWRMALVFFYMSLDAEANLGPNNITRIEYPSGEITEFDYTYNENGYPLTIKSSNEDFVRYEYVYKKK